MDLKKYHLVYNAAAHFAAQDKFPESSLMEAIGQNGLEGYTALCWALAELSTQGELVRRDMGHDRQEPITQAKVMLHLKPIEVLVAKQLVIQAIADGLKSEEDESAEVDEVLAELQKKTEAE